MPSHKSVEALGPGLVELFDKMEIREHRRARAENIFGEMMFHKPKYISIEKATGVPWIVVAAIHYKESKMNWNKNLHNGQSIYKVTTIVPKGRGPFASFEASAVDALKLLKQPQIDMAKSRNWDMAAMLWFCYAYNGFGYLKKTNANGELMGLATPYLFSSTTAYEIGGYYSDGNFKPDHKITDVGCAAFLKLAKDSQTPFRVFA